MSAPVGPTRLLDPAGGSGVITPFFLINDGTELGRSWQEMDFEVFGRASGDQYQTQVMTPGSPRTQHIVDERSRWSLTQAYHTYRMEWTPEKLAFYLDGKLVREERNRQTYEKLLDPTKADPMRVRISVWAADNNWSGRFDVAAIPAHVFVRYIRLEHYTPHGGSNGSDFSLAWQDDFKWLDRGRWNIKDAPADITAVNDFNSGNATVKDGYLVLSLTRNGESGFNGAIPYE